MAKITPKLLQKGSGTEAKKIVKEKNKIGGISLPNFQT